MKKSEIEALKEAFNIPEPENKNDFIRICEERFEENKRKFRPIMIFRYTSAAVMAAVVVGLCGIAGKNTDFNDNFNKVQVIESTSEGDSSDSSTLYSDAAATGSAVQSTAAATVSGGSSSNSVTTGINTTSAEENSIEKESEAGEPSEADVPEKDEITTENTSEPDNFETTSAPAATEKVTQTTVTEPITDKEPDKDIDEPIRDYTVIPSVIYYPDDSVYRISTDRPTNATDGLTKPPTNPDDIDLVTDYVFAAELDEIIYTEIGGEPYIQENITVISELHGDGKFERKDKISVFIKGGYMPVEEFAENHNWIKIPSGYSYVYCPEENIPEQEVGSKYFFFLDKSSLIPGNEVFITKCIISG